MATPSNADVANALYEIADLLEIKGGDRFRFLAYRRAAEAIEGYAAPVAELKEAQLVAITGVGKGMAARVKEFAESGRLKALDDLRAQVPIGLRQMTLLPGLGPKRAMQLFKELGVSNLDELKAAAEQHRVASVKGFGKRFEEEVLAALERGVQTEQRLMIARALPAAQELLARLNECDAVIASAYAGSLRRMKETIGDVDLLASSERPNEVMDAFRSLRGVVSSKADGATKSSIVTASGLQVDLRVVEPVAFGAALQYFTGSQAHNVKIRARAVRRKLKLSEYGLFKADTDERIVSETEEEVYEALGMQWIPPTMREDRGEIEAAIAGELPDVVTLEEIRGDLQSHSVYSDGQLTVREMALAAKAKGYEYYAVTDHGPALTFMDTLGPREIEAQRAEVRAIDKEMGAGFHVLHGVELNMAMDGSLDYDDDVLKGFDWCIASLHSNFKASRRDQTKRFLHAISNPYVHVIGHPSGRRLDRREGVDFDLDAIAKACAKNNVALEISAHPGRLDLRDEHVRLAREHGVKFVISTDAHSAGELDNMHFGVGTAQRGWAESEQVINTWPWERFKAFVDAKR